MATSPNITNYYVGKGNAYFTPTGGVEAHMGNAPSWKITPKITKLDHFSSQVGIKSKDKSIVQAKEATIDITLDEITIDNLQIALFGTTGSAGNFNILTSSGSTGALRFTGENDVGNRFEVIIPSVSFTPGQGIDFISDGFGVIQLTGDILAVAGSFGTVTETVDATS